MLRVSAGGVIVLTLGAAGVLSATAFRGRNAARRAIQPTAPVTAVVADTAPHKAPVQTVVPAVTVSEPTAASTAPIAAEKPVEVASHAPFAPIVPQGESSLASGPTALRADSVVTVSFDKAMMRTRIPAKFELLVRSTLPAIYGRSIDSVLAKVPAGGIVSQGDLLSELPSRGARIPVNAGWTLALYPETRPGADGPLVVRYRVSLVAKD